MPIDQVTDGTGTPRDPERFVAEFSGSERTVAAYLLAEVLERFGAERVLGGLCFVCLNRTAPGVIEQTGTHRRVVFGLDKQGITDIAVNAAKLCRKLEDTVPTTAVRTVLRRMQRDVNSRVDFALAREIAAHARAGRGASGRRREEILKIVPDNLREAAYALGTPK